MKLQKISPLTSYQTLFGGQETIAPLNQEVFTESILIGELEQYIYSENNSLMVPFLVQRKKIKELMYKLFEIKPLAEEFIPYLAWVIIKFGQSNLSQKITSLITASSAIEYSERYYRMLVREGAFLKGKDGVDIARLKLQSENQVFGCFFEMRSRIKEILEFKVQCVKLEEEIKSIEKKIRDLNQQIKTMRAKPFQIDGSNSEISRFGDYAGIKGKIDAIQDKIDNTPGLDEVTAKKWQAGIDLMQPDLDIYMSNNQLEQNKSQMKNTVKVWGDEIKVKKEKMKEYEEESDLISLKQAREIALQKIIDKNQIEEEFIKFSVEKENEGESTVDGEMISVGAAARLAEAMKSNFPSGFMMSSPTVSTVTSSGPETNISIPDNRPLKPDFDYSHRDKDRLIQLIYASDEKGIKFEKSAETLEALAYKSPSKAAKILIDQKISDASFFM